MSSDGYPDQFEGPEEKKAMKKRIFDLITEIAALQISEQESRLVEEHNEWIGDLEQTDDICLIGVRI